MKKFKTLEQQGLQVQILSASLETIKRMFKYLNVVVFENIGFFVSYFLSDYEEYIKKDLLLDLSWTASVVRDDLRVEE